MNHVGEVMKSDLEFCAPETRVPDIKYLMKRYNYHDIFVVDLKLLPLGIVHEGAISDESLKQVIHPFDVKAKECMEKIKATINKDSTLDNCLEIMSQNNTEVLPVVDNDGHCCGMVTKKDVLLKH